MALMGAKIGLSVSAQRRLEASWAEGFRRAVMPELLSAEDSFSILYADGGRPNWSVARLLGVCLLQQLQNHSDQEALDALSFDARWQHALDIAGDDAYLSRRSLVEFRRRLVDKDPDGSLLRGVFDRVLSAGIEGLNLETSEQRLDSTIVASNIRAHGRLSLVRETLRVFIRSLDGGQRQRLPKEVLDWYESKRQWESLDDKGDQSERARRLHEAGGWVCAVLQAFSDDVGVTSTAAYQRLVRLASEHAQSLGLSEDQAPADDDNDTDHSAPPPSAANADERRRGRNTRKARKRAEKSSKARYWSPHDPDASFGHKGLGYHVHITETCRNKRTELLTDYGVVTAAQSDIGQSAPVLARLAERDLLPETMYADGGYPTPEHLLHSRKLGTELYAPVNRGRMPSDSMSRVDFKTDPLTGKVLQCPAGHTPTRHGQRDSSDAVHSRRALHVFFDVDKCTPCAQRKRCPVRQPNNARSREFRLELSAELNARDQRWSEQTTEPWRRRYRIRSGVEATMSELKRAHGLGRLRVRGIARVGLQVALKATACNIKRWLRGHIAALLYALLASLCARSSRTRALLPVSLPAFRMA